MKKMLILCSALAAAATAAAQPEPAAPQRSYDFRHLDARVAEVLFWQVCDEEGEARCVVLNAEGDELVVRADLAVQRRMARLFAERDVLPVSQRLQLHVLGASPDTTALPDRLEGEPRRALEDFAAALGPRRFTLLDSASIETTDMATTHLAGPGGVVLVAQLRVREVTGVDGDELHVDVRLSLPGGQPATAEGGVTVRPGDLLQTSLSLEAGETVVVGTSRLNGGEEGLVLLLTALR